MKTHSKILSGILYVVLTSCGPSDGNNGFASQEGTPGTFATLQVLSESDYAVLTGCGTNHSYVEAHMLALEYLVFSNGKGEAREWGYRRRHIYPFFDHLKDSDGNIPAKCLPLSTRLIGESMGLLRTLESPENKPDELFYDSAASDFPKDHGNTLEVMSRKAYMATTDCLLSPTSWKAYKNAVRAYLGQQRHGQPALEEAVEALFAELNASRPPGSGVVSEQCLTPGVRAMGIAAGLLEPAP